MASLPSGLDDKNAGRTLLDLGEDGFCLGLRNRLAVVDAREEVKARLGDRAAKRSEDSILVGKFADTNRPEGKRHVRRCPPAEDNNPGQQPTQHHSAHWFALDNSGLRRSTSEVVALDFSSSSSATINDSDRHSS
jgi:hypothetical protein